MAAPKLYRDWEKKAVLAREDGKSNIDRLSLNECRALFACYSEKTSSLADKNFNRSRARKALYACLKNVDAKSMLELVHDVLPTLDRLEQVYKKNKLVDENMDDYLLFVVNIYHGIEECLAESNSNWAKDRICQRANYVAILLHSFYMLKGLALITWYNRIMQYICFAASPQFLQIPHAFVISELSQSYETLNPATNDDVKKCYLDTKLLLTNPKLRKARTVKATVQLLWKKSPDSVTGEDIENLCEFPALIFVLAENCNELPGGYATRRKRTQDEDCEFDPKSEAIVRVTKRSKVELVVAGESETKMPKLVMTQKIRNVQSFVHESENEKTVYTETALVARLILSSNSFASKDPFGLTVMVSPKLRPSHFVNIPKLVSSFYKPAYSKPQLDRNTYCGLFLGWFPIWVVVTAKDVVVYTLPVDDYVDLFDHDANMFDMKKFHVYEPRFESCDVFEQKVFGANFLSVLIGRVAVTMCIITKKHDPAMVVLSDEQIPVFRSGAFNVIKAIFRFTANAIELHSASIFRPLMAVCNLRKPANEQVTCEDLKTNYLTLINNLAGCALPSQENLAISF